MSPRRRAAILALRALLVSSLLATAIVLHVPGPTGLGPAREAEVRGAWTTAGRIARALAAYAPDVPAFLEGLVSDKTIHFVLFVALAASWAAARALERTLDRRGALIVLGTLAAYAALGEAAQALEGRIADPGDWVANVLGAAVGTLGVLALHRAVRRARRARAPVTAPAE